MRDYDELKLAVYESTNISALEKECMITMMESCEGDDLEEVCDVIEESVGKGKKDINDDVCKELRKNFDAVDDLIKKFKDQKKKESDDAEGTAKEIIERMNACHKLISDLGAYRDELNDKASDGCEKSKKLADITEDNIKHAHKEYTKTKVLCVACGSAKASDIPNL